MIESSKQNLTNQKWLLLIDKFLLCHIEVDVDPCLELNSEQVVAT